MPWSNFLLWHEKDGELFSSIFFLIFYMKMPLPKQQKGEWKNREKQERKSHNFFLLECYMFHSEKRESWKIKRRYFEQNYERKINIKIRKLWACMNFYWNLKILWCYFMCLMKFDALKLLLCALILFKVLWWCYELLL